MNPLEYWRDISEIAQSGHGGFIYVSLGFLFVASVLSRLLARKIKRLESENEEFEKAQEERIVKLEKDLADCTSKNYISDAQLGNIKMSLSALYAIAMLSGDKRLSGMQLHDLLEGRLALQLIVPTPGDGVIARPDHV